LHALRTPAFCQTDKEDIKKAINTMFDAMRKGDSTMLKSVFKDMAGLPGRHKKDGTVVLRMKNPMVLKAVGTPHKEVWDERITYGDIKWTARWPACGHLTSFTWGKSSATVVLTFSS
jgi:hypothetical protein